MLAGAHDINKSLFSQEQPLLRLFLGYSCSKPVFPSVAPQLVSGPFPLSLLHSLCPRSRHSFCVPSPCSFSPDPIEYRIFLPVSLPQD